MDARAGHGSKPISKINKVKKPAIAVITKVKPAAGMDISDKMRNVMKKHISPSESYITSLGRNRAHSPSGCSDDVQSKFFSPPALPLKIFSFINDFQVLIFFLN